jgi:hypothetical protein
VFPTNQAQKLFLSFVDAIAKSFGLASVRSSSIFRWYYGKKTDRVQVSVLDNEDETICISTSLSSSTADDTVIIDNWLDCDVHKD